MREFPFGGLPEPDLLIISACGGCVPVMKIFHALERRFPNARVHSAGIAPGRVEEIDSITSTIT